MKCTNMTAFIFINIVLYPCTQIVLFHCFVSETSRIKLCNQLCRVSVQALQTMVVLMTRVHIMNVASSVAKILQNRAWYGVMKYAQNDDNWVTLGRNDKVSTDSIIANCDFSGAASSTKSKMIKIVNAVKEAKSIKAAIKILTTMKTATTPSKTTSNSLFASRFLEIAHRIETKEGNFSSCDAYDYLEKETCVKLTTQQRTIRLERLMKANKIERSGLRANDFKFVASASSTSAATTHSPASSIIPPTIDVDNTNSIASSSNNRKRKFNEISNSCTICTFDNHHLLTKCEMCGNDLH